MEIHSMALGQPISPMIRLAALKYPHNYPKEIVA